MMAAMAKAGSAPMAAVDTRGPEAPGPAPEGPEASAMAALKERWLEDFLILGWSCWMILIDFNDF